MTTTPTPPPAVVSSDALALPLPKTGRASRSRAGLYPLLIVLVVLVVARSVAREPNLSLASLRHVAAQLRNPVPSQTALPTSVSAQLPRAADAKLRRDGYATVRGGVLYIPETFSSKDGSYDLLIHFHGNVKVIVESAEVASVNSLVAVINLGVGSAVYEDAYAIPGTYESLIEQVHRAITDRGLTHASLRRVALSSWSAGYGAISTILQVRRGTDPLDAIFLSDGLHCGRLPEQPSKLNHRQMAPFVRAARRAASGEILFSITHSEIDPVTYVASRDTASYLLDAVRERATTVENPVEAPAHLHLKSAVNAVEPSLEKKMEPTRDLVAGQLHVRGFRGQTKEHHSAHLLQIGATLFPELSQRWGAEH